MQILVNVASGDFVWGTYPLASIEDSFQVRGVRPSICPEQKPQLQTQGVWGLGPGRELWIMGNINLQVGNSEDIGTLGFKYSAYILFIWEIHCFFHYYITLCVEYILQLKYRFYIIRNKTKQKDIVPNIYLSLKSKAQIHSEPTIRLLNKGEIFLSWIYTCKCIQLSLYPPPHRS